MDASDKKDAAVEVHPEEVDAPVMVDHNDNNTETSVSSEVAECASAMAQLSAIRDPAKMGSKLSELIHQTQQLYVTLCQVATAQQQAPGSAVPPMNGGDGKAPQHWKNPQLFKTSICEHWRTTGRCRFGARCWYAHGSYELRYVPRLEKRQPAPSIPDRKRDKPSRISPTSQLPSLLSIPATAPFVPMESVSQPFSSYAATAPSCNIPMNRSNQGIGAPHCNTYQHRPRPQGKWPQQSFNPNQQMLYPEPQDWYYFVPTSGTAVGEPLIGSSMPPVMQTPSTPPHEIGDQEEPATTSQPRNNFQKSFRPFGESYPLRALNLF